MIVPVEQTYPLDANGIPIKPGYREPFNSESGRKAGIESARVNARAREDAKIARATLRQIHAMLTKRKSTKKPHLAGIPNQTSRVTKKTVKPISHSKNDTAILASQPSGNQGDVARPAPVQASPASDDDCPF